MIYLATKKSLKYEVWLTVKTVWIRNFHKKKDLSDKKKDLSDKKKDLSDEKKDLSDKKKDLSDEKKDLSDKKKDLSDEKKDLSDEKKDLSDEKGLLKTYFSHFHWFTVILIGIMYFPKTFIYSHVWNKFQYGHYFQINKTFSAEIFSDGKYSRHHWVSLIPCTIYKEYFSSKQPKT